MFSKRIKAVKAGEKLCPSFQSPCIKHDCVKYINVRGTHPQTGAEIDRFDCSDVWIPILLINAASEARQGAAATESLRNKMVETLEKSRLTAIALAQQEFAARGLALPQAPVPPLVAS